jgi:hypothetical protein
MIVERVAQLRWPIPHPQRVSGRPEANPCVLDEIYVNQGCYGETAGFTLVKLKTRHQGWGDKVGWTEGKREATWTWMMHCR